MKKRAAKNIWVKRFLLLVSVLVVYYLVASLLVLAISPTGPGSGRIVFISLSFISFVAAFFLKNELKYMLYFGAIVFFILFIYALVERNSFRKKMEMRREEVGLEAGGRGSAHTF